MPRLSIHLLGSFQVNLDGEPVTGFESDKVRTLLAYLAVEAGGPHRREKLAGLCWPELPERSARNNLRVALANLRKLLGDHARAEAHEATPPFLFVSRQSIQVNPEADVWLDVAELTLRLETTGRPRRVIPRLAEAVDLYRGGFLEGLSLPDSVTLEEWALLEREHLQRKVVVGLQRLAGWYERRGAYQQALTYARRQVLLEPWQEQGQRQVMRLLVLTGQRNAALAQYQGLRRMLAADLGVEPEDETEALYRRIRQGQDLRLPDPRPTLPDEAEISGVLRPLGAYQIIEEIGTSGLATIYRAYQPAMDRYVAVKVIHASMVSDKEAVARFEREAHFVASLEHLHILPIYDFDGTHEPPYIVMRYVEGGTIRGLLVHGPMPLEEVAYLIRQIGSALHYAHGQGIVHRDVKPDNILIDTEGNAFVSDFGIADIVKHASQGGEPSMVKDSPWGTPGYMAPEQIMGSSAVDERADVYALGVMLYEMVTGTLPFRAANWRKILDQHLKAPIPDARGLRPEIPPMLSAVIQRAMAKEPGERYSSAAEFVAATTAAISGSAGTQS